MGLFSGFSKLFRRQSRAMPLSLGPGEVASASMIGRGPPRRGTRELMMAYREQPWLRAVTSRIAGGVASASWSVYAAAEEPVSVRSSTYRTRITATGKVRDVVRPPSFRWGADRAVIDRKLRSPDIEVRAARRRELAEAGLLREISDHPILELLEAPNTLQTGRAAMQVSQTHIDLKGEAFWALKRDKNGTPAGYITLPPHWISQIPTETNPFFRVSYGTLQLMIPATDMVWFRQPDPENPFGRGTGIAESLGDELETDEFAAKYLKSWFYNGAMPSFLASFEGATAPQLKIAKEEWQQQHRGVENAHQVHFASGKMNVQRLDASFQDQQISDLRKLQRDTIAQVFAVPPEIIGIIENSNRSTIGAARYIYALGVEFPRVEFLRSELQHQLVPQFDKALCLEVEIPLPEDEDHRLAVMQTLPGAFDLNEWRNEAGYEPLPDFEGVFPPLAMPGQTGPTTDADTEDDADATTLEAGDPEGDEDDQEVGTLDGDERARVDPPWARHLVKIVG